MNCTFNRREKKYLLTPEQHIALIARLSEHMTVDRYGKSTICSIYYDSDNDMMIQQSLSKPVYKEKLRLRSYGVPKAHDTVYIELKKKYKGIVYKRREAMEYLDAVLYLNSGIMPPQQSQILSEIEWTRGYYRPRPKVMIAYDRIAMFGRDDPELRLTIDENIRCRDTDLLLERGDVGVPLLQAGRRLMEIKALGAIPLWLSHTLSELHIYPTSFSKYGTYYTIKEQEEQTPCSQVFSIRQAN